MEEIIATASLFNLDTTRNLPKNEVLPDFGNNNLMIGSTVGITEITDTLTSQILPQAMPHYKLVIWC